MGSIDERVVAMSFENQVFEARVAQTMSTLGKLDTAIKNIGSVNGLDNIEKSANKVTLQGPMSALDKLKARFSRAGTDAADGLNSIEKQADKVTLQGPSSALDKLKQKLGFIGTGGEFAGIQSGADKVNLGGLDSQVEGTKNHFDALRFAAIVAFGTIVHKATNMALQVAKSVTVLPLIDGFRSYQDQINAAQTIMANTGLKGAKGLAQVEVVLHDLNKYAVQTVYSFSDMTQNIGRFTAAGVKLQPATDAIKGMANMAALTGTNTVQLGTAMYQTSQALATGIFRLQDWNSLANANLGTKNMQETLQATATTLGDHGKKMKDAIKQQGSFRQSLQAGWLTTDIFTKGMKVMAGTVDRATGKYRAFTVEELKGMGYTEAQAKHLNQLSQAAIDSATKIRTLTQMSQALKEEVGTAWSAVFKTLFGDLNGATNLFSKLHTTLENMLTNPIYAFNKVLQDWAKLGGRSLFLNSLKDGFHELGQVVGAVKGAFHDIFPPTTGRDLLNLTKGFHNFVESMKPSQETLKNLRDTFKGVFAVLDIGWYVVKKVIGVIFSLIGTAGKGGGGILKFTGGIGNFLAALDKAIVKGDAFKGFFQSITNVLRVPLTLLGSLASAFFGLFGGMDKGKAKGAADGLTSVGNSLKPMKAILDQAANAWHRFTDFLANTVKPLAMNIGHWLSNLGGAIVSAFSNMNFDPVFAIITTGLIGGILLAIRKGFGGLGEAVKGAGGGFMGNINSILKGVTGNLTAMQKNIQAGTLMKIAIAIGVLAAGIALLSTIDPGKLTKAMTAVAVGLGQLVVALALLSKVTTGAGFLSMPLLAASMVELSVAVTILAGAMKIFGTMSWNEIAKGLVGVGGGLLAMAVGLKVMSGPQLLIMGPGLIAVAVAMGILGSAMKIFASMSWGEIAKGLVAIGVSLLEIQGGLIGLGPELLLTGPGLIAAALGLSMLAGSVGAFGHLGVDTLAKGIVGMSVALVALGVAVQTIPPTIALQAAGLVVLAVALTGIAGVVGIMGKMNLGTLVKGIVALAGVLVVLAAGLTAMEGTLPGSVALLAAAGALAIMAPTLALMGNLSWGTILTGLGAIALTLGTLALVGVVASEGILALGVALLPFGLAVLAAGAGMALLVTAFGKLGDTGQKAIASIILAITALAAALPGMVLGFVKGLLQVVVGITQLAPQIVASIVKIGSMLLTAIVQLAPKIGEAMGALVQMLLTVIVRDSPKLIQAGFTLVMNLLKGLDDNISGITYRAVNTVIRFINGIAGQAGNLTEAGARFIVSFLNGIAKHVGDVASSAAKVVANFVGGLLGLPTRVLSIAVRAISGFIGGISRGVPKLIGQGVRVVTNILNGISSQFGKIAATATSFVVRFFNAFGSRTNVAKMVHAGLMAAVHVLQGVADGINQASVLPQIINAAVNIGEAIVTGIAKGLAGLPGKLAGKLLSPLNSAVHKAKKLLDIGSPSKVFIAIGEFIVAGLGIGLLGLGNVLEKGINHPIGEMLRKNHDLGEFGKFLGTEFRQGLTGGLWDDGKSDAQKQIEGAFNALKDKLSEEQKKLKDSITSDEDKLKQALNAKDKNWGQINALYTRIAQEKLLLAQSKMASNTLIANLQGEEGALIQLAAQYQAVSVQLDEAKQHLDQLKQERAQAIQQYIDQFSQTPDIAGLLDQAMQEASMTWAERWDAQRKKQDEDRQRAQIDQVANYKKALQDQIAATQQYMSTLGKLRAAGLDDTTYKKLLSMGLAGQQFASQLLSGGPQSIKQINQLDSQLAQAAGDLANEAGAQLYDAGIQAAQGLVDGLQAKQDGIRKAMEDIAKSMIDAIKSQLGIKSPSRIFAEIGSFAIEGLANGFKASTDLVTNAVANVGDKAAAALTDSLANVSDRVQNSINTDVTITPVLDLSQVQKDASKIDDLSNVVPITAAASYGQASAISTETQATAAAQADVAAQPPIEVNLEQNNISPKALDDIEIYRQTKNQLSQVKSALGIVPRDPRAAFSA